MAPPLPLAAIGEVTLRQAFERWIDDMKAYHDLRNQMMKLQGFVSEQCR